MSIKSRTLKVKKGQILQHTGEFNSKVYFVMKGLLRSYNIDSKGKEHIFMFAPEGWTMGDATDGDSPTELFIDALEDTECLVREKNHNRDGTPNGFKTLAKRMLVLQRRVLMMMSASAIDRYEHFEKTYPDLVRRVPQKMIAGYLGITPEALSKIRSERAKNK